MTAVAAIMMHRRTVVKRSSNMCLDAVFLQVSLVKFDCELSLVASLSQTVIVGHD